MTWSIQSIQAIQTVSKVVKLTLTLPLSSATCERDNKNQVQISPVSQTWCTFYLSNITAETFDPKPAVDLWMETISWRHLPFRKLK